MICRLRWIALALLSSSVYAQPIRSYSSYEDYCRDNPKAPTCTDGHPLVFKPLTGMPSATLPPNRSASRTVRAQGQPEGPVSGVALQDWRFSHPAPAMLISINIGSLLQSPLLAALFPAAGMDAADIEKARSALGDIGQVLISITQNGTTKPSTLILVRGNIDSALGSLMRSGSGMQAKRLDAATMLIGDANSLEMASQRMRSPTVRATYNSLQKAATLEALKFDTWVGLDPRRMAPMVSALGGGSNPGLAMVANMRSISVGVYLRDQVRMEATLDTPSPDAADRMLATYQAKPQSGIGRVGQEWVTTEGSKIQFIAIVEARRFKSLPGFDTATAQMGSQIAPLIRALAGIGQASQSGSIAAPKPAHGAIMIQGLDDGPREIPAR
jgi:hypothetical protein